MYTKANNMIKVKQGVRRTCGIISSIAMAKSAFNKKKALSTNKLDFIVREKLVKFYVSSIDLYSASTCTL
jgi:hypothetical protein